MTSSKEGKAKVGKGVSTAAEKTKDVAGDAVDKTKEVAGTAAEKTKEVAGTVVEKTKEVTHTGDDKTKERPAAGRRRQRRAECRQPPPGRGAAEDGSPRPRAASERSESEATPTRPGGSGGPSGVPSCARPLR